MRVKLWFSGHPLPWATGIASGGHRYVLEKTREWQETVGWQARAQWKSPPLEGDLGVEWIFFRENKIRVDIKNLVTAMEDALAGIVYGDDSQFKVTKTTLRYSKEHPGVEVTIWTL